MKTSTIAALLMVAGVGSILCAESGAAVVGLIFVLTAFYPALVNAQRYQHLRDGIGRHDLDVKLVVTNVIGLAPDALVVSGDGLDNAVDNEADLLDRSGP